MTKKQELLVYKGYQGTVEYSLAALWRGDWDQEPNFLRGDYTGGA